MLSVKPPEPWLTYARDIFWGGDGHPAVAAGGSHTPTHLNRCKEPGCGCRADTLKCHKVVTAKVPKPVSDIIAEQATDLLDPRLPYEHREQPVV